MLRALEAASGGASIRRTRVAVAGAILAVWLGLPASAPATTSSFAPQADAYVNSRYPDANYGKKQSLVADASPTRVSYLRFDVVVPSDAVIDAAKLELYARTDSTSVGYFVDPVSDNSWRETDITYSNAPSTAVSSLAISSPVDGLLRAPECDPLCSGEPDPPEPGTCGGDEVSGHGRPDRGDGSEPGGRRRAGSRAEAKASRAERGRRRHEDQREAGCRGSGRGGHRAQRRITARRLATSAGWSSPGYQGVDLPASSIQKGLNSFAAGTSTSTAVFFDSREGANQPRLEVTYSTSGSQPPDGAAPAPPSGLRAQGGDGRVSLDWDDNGESNLAGYRVYRRTADGDWSGTPLAATTASSYTDSDVTNGQAYAYRVTAYDDSGGESQPSATAEATPQATPPSGPGGAIRPPASGALFGAWVSSNTGYTVDQREAQIGRKFAIVHRYHGWTEQFPEPQETKWAQGGRTLYLSWDARVFATNTPTPWSKIADGSQDAVIDAAAARIRSLGKPVFMDFSQEPEAEVDDGRYGTASDFAAAFRHVVERFRAQGATNVAWVWSVMGYSGYYRYYTGGLYPGDDVVDWIGWDPYNWYRCHDSAWASFEDKVRTFYDWLSQNGHGDKPLMLSEYGTRESDVDAQAKQRWFVDELAALKSGAFPNLKALVYFDSHPKACNWRIDSSKPALDGFRQLANDPYLNP